MKLEKFFFNIKRKSFLAYPGHLFFIGGFILTYFISSQDPEFFTY